MDDLPKELLDEIHDLALAIINAGTVGDQVVAESVYLRLRELYQINLETGKGHPFLTEVLADFTLDSRESVQLYKEAIRQCAALPNEPVHTKMLSLAETLVEIGRLEEAEAYLITARQHAQHCSDADALKEIHVLLERIRRNTD